jgi:hypothetical protein
MHETQKRMVDMQTKEWKMRLSYVTKSSKDLTVEPSTAQVKAINIYKNGFLLT